jgi:hypothetical protein
VKEVVVISHTHQGMFWHLMVSEFFRIFTMLPYIQANEDVYIHLGWPYPHVLMDSLYKFINIPKYVTMTIPRSSAERFDSCSFTLTLLSVCDTGSAFCLTPRCKRT